MLELPGAAWRDRPWPRPEALGQAPQRADWLLAGEVRHGLTHFELQLDVYAASVARIEAPGLLRRAGELAGEALPSVMRKCVRIAANSGAVLHPVLINDT